MSSISAARIAKNILMKRVPFFVGWLILAMLIGCHDPLHKQQHQTSERVLVSVIDQQLASGLPSVDAFRNIYGGKPNLEQMAKLKSAMDLRMIPVSSFDVRTQSEFFGKIAEEAMAVGFYDGIAFFTVDFQSVALKTEGGDYVDAVLKSLKGYGKEVPLTRIVVEACQPYGMSFFVSKRRLLFVSGVGPSEWH